MMENMRYEHLLIFLSFMAITWFIVIYFLPRLLLTVFKRAILVKGFGDGPIPMNTLYTQSQASFADPLKTSGSSLMTTGVNRDTIIALGWLDLGKGPQILHVPEMAGRYYSVQLTDPSKNTNFAYVGKRTTGTGSGDFLLCGPGKKWDVQKGVSLISSPNQSVLIICRVLVESDSDLSTAYGLTKQISLSPLALS